MGGHGAVVAERGISDLQKHREQHEVSLQEALKNGFGEAALNKYQEITGFKETNSDATGIIVQSFLERLAKPAANLCAHQEPTSARNVARLWPNNSFNPTAGVRPLSERHPRPASG